jgi:hypothetical protein
MLLTRIEGSAYSLQADDTEDGLNAVPALSGWRIRGQLFSRA